MRICRLFEFHEQSWMPKFLRHSVTDQLSALFSHYHMYHPIVGLLAKLLRQTGKHKIMDFCSGSGDTLFEIQKELKEQYHLPISIELSDKFPNADHFQKAHQYSDIYYHPAPVDALNYTKSTSALRTFFTAFHHFTPEQAKNILASALHSQDPIAIFEFTDRSCARFLFDLIIPASVLYLTPRLRPVSKAQLFFTYLLPVIPLISWWDGIVSNFRTYSQAQLQSLVQSLPSENYHWEIGSLPAGLRFYRITYLLGWPKHDSA